MTDRNNRHWVLSRYPDGMPTPDCWQLQTSEMPTPGDGQMLVETCYLSVDPYMRGRISPQKNYAQSVEIGETMHGGGVGRVIESRHPDFAVGDFVESMTFGWQEYTVLDAAGTRVVDPSLGPIHSSLSYLGMPGLTAYFGLLRVANLQPGDNVVVSAASGAVGQIVGQIAKLMGARAIGVAGRDDKLAWCRELGFDETINYRTESDLTAAIANACPSGVDVYFDNTGGDILDAVMNNLAQRARIVICGTISQAATFGQPDIGIRHMRNILVARARMEGLLVFDFLNDYPRALKALSHWSNIGLLRHREDISEGISSVPESFIRVLNGENFGKQLIRIRD